MRICIFVYISIICITSIPFLLFREAFLPQNARACYSASWSVAKTQGEGLSGRFADQGGEAPRTAVG